MAAGECTGVAPARTVANMVPHAPGAIDQWHLCLPPRPWRAVCSCRRRRSSDSLHGNATPARGGSPRSRALFVNKYYSSAGALAHTDQRGAAGPPPSVLAFLAGLPCTPSCGTFFNSSTIQSCAASVHLNTCYQDLQGRSSSCKWKGSWKYPSGIENTHPYTYLYI